jgi:L-alanine-DL-glutamate epimerase-like enolase superfamily enzyme
VVIGALFDSTWAADEAVALCLLASDRQTRPIMQIETAEVIALEIPFTDGSSGTGLMPNRWTKVQIALLKLQTSDGLIGWGEGFAYAHLQTTVTALNELVLPLVVGQTIESPAEFNRQLQQKLHLHGRYGITQFAMSAVDIALWDIKAKQAGKSLAALLNTDHRDQLPAYASLVRYGEPDTVAQYTADAVNRGYQTIKLHEITLENIRAGRDAAPHPIQLTTDVNCNWTPEQAQALMPHMRDMQLYWVEEPLFPPDSEQQLTELQSDYGVSIASGENACTSVEFARLAGSIDILQPSVIKVGGISEFLQVCELAESADKTIMPHSPYFGPGYQATLQLMAAQPVCGLFEHLFIDLENYLDPQTPLSRNGTVALPESIGLGFTPDPSMLARYRIN